ncbi:MAG: hypothetical protein U0904_06580 [Candidatus Nanopelagicales bacterium]|nr:hypothetical protein [Candidatus Nanopelagicales bacterium]
MIEGYDLPDTLEVRARLDEAQADSLARMGLDAHTVAVWEDGWRTARDVESTFEWWYFDMQLDDGSTLVATFNTKPSTHPSGPLQPSVLLIYHGPDGSKIRVSQPCEESGFRAATEACDVRIGPNTVAGDLDTYVLHIDVAGVVADLTIKRGAPSWRPGAGVSWFDSAHKHYLAWVVPVPYGSVAGTITDASGTREVSGSAYHDHNWGNRLMSDYLDHWYWGRAHIEDFTVVYVRMTTKGIFGFGSINFPTFYLAKGERLLTDDILPLRLETGEEVPGPGDQTYPSELTWKWQTDAGSVQMRVTKPKLIEALDMAEDAGALRRTLIHALGGHPMYYDFNADMELSVDLGGVKRIVKGRTLFEKMMFR